MSFSLYRATVPSFLQILRSQGQLLETAEQYCREHNQNPAVLIQARLADDMLPFSFQIVSVCHHSLGAVDGVRAGVAGPPQTEPPEDFASLKDMIAGARTGLETVTEEELDAMAEKDVSFEFGEHKLPFTGAEFLLSFSQPNFYFHATTAYDILRFKGLPIGKQHFLGQLRTKGQ